MITKPLSVRALPEYNIHLKYDDGTEGTISLAHLSGNGVFRQWGKTKFFNIVHIDELSKSIAWDDTIQLCPNTLYLQLKGISFEQWKKENEVYGSN